MTKKKRLTLVGDIVGVLVTALVFLVPFYFMLVNSLKSQQEAGQLSMSFPAELHFDNYLTVFQYGNFQLLTAFKNSILLTLFTVIGLVITGAMAAYVIQRRRGKAIKLVEWLIMLGLMIPASILPTIHLLQSLGLYKTMLGMVLIEIALQTPFTIMLFRGYMASIPVDLEEAARIDGCNSWQIFYKIINPLYFLPGAKNVTVQLTLYNYKGQFANSYNLLFADIIIITIPMLILFLLFNKKIVDGMVAGSVKG